MDSSLIINATSTTGKKVTKAISNINPEKDNSILKIFAQKVNALSTNTYSGAKRVNQMDVEEPGGGSSGGSSKQAVTFNVSFEKYDSDPEHINYDINITTNSDGRIFCKHSIDVEELTASGGVYTYESVEPGDPFEVFALPTATFDYGYYTGTTPDE